MKMYQYFISFRSNKMPLYDLPNNDPLMDKNLLFLFFGSWECYSWLIHLVNILLGPVI